MKGKVLVEGLEIECIIGIHPHEREQCQLILVDCILECDFARAVETDDFAHAVDYVAVSETLTRTARDGAFQLIETMAEAMAQALLKDDAVEKVCIKIMKPAAVPQASWAAVEIERRR